MKSLPKRTSVIGFWRAVIRGMLLPALLIALLSGHAAAQTGLRVGDVFPKVSLQDLEGKTVAVPDAAAGKIVIFHFWASWCPLCVREMGALEEIRKAYGEKGVVPYSIDAGETAEVAAAYVRTTPATYAILLDPTMAFTKQCGVLSIPTTFVCDREGKIRFKILGEISKMGLEKLLSVLLR